MGFFLFSRFTCCVGVRHLCHLTVRKILSVSEIWHSQDKRQCSAQEKVISQMNGRLVTYLSLRWIAMGFLSEGTEPVPAERGYLVLTLKSSYLISKVASI